MIDFCKEKDRDSLLALWDGFDRAHLDLSSYYFKKTTLAEREKRHDKYFENKNTLYLVASHENKIVGFLCGMFRSTPSVCLLRERELLEVHGIFVEPEQRRRGVSTKLLERALMEAQKRGVDDMEIFTWDCNKSLLKPLSDLGLKRLSSKYGVSLRG